jgi:epoxide hydrolase-like predicted phosphatase
MSEIKAVLFDYGGVLSRSGEARSVERMLAKHWQIDPDKLDIEDFQALFQRGDIDSEEFFSAIQSQYPQYPLVNEEVFLELNKEIYQPKPEVYGLAQKMRDHGIATGIISNVFPISAERIRELGGYNFFHPIVLSFEVRRIKPDPEIYELALERLNMEPQEVALIDDDEKNLKPARKIGMYTIRAFNEFQLSNALPRAIAEKNGINVWN